NAASPGGAPEPPAAGGLGGPGGVPRVRRWITTAKIAPAVSTTANGMIHASRLKPCIVGEDRTFSPNFAWNAPRIWSFDSPRASRSAISFLIGSPDPHWMWLHECTVSPQPHWQVSDSSISRCEGAGLSAYTS